MLRLLATLSPGAVLLIGALGVGLPAGFVGYRAGYWSGHRAGVKYGTSAVVADVQKQNAVAGEAARRVKSTVDACYDRAGVWNHETGTCDR